MSNKNNQNIEQTTNKSLWKDKKNKNYLFFIAIIFFLICPLCARGFDMKELLPIKHNVFIKGPKMHVYHNGPAVLMNDGNVLVIGGNTQKAEIYDYKKNKFVYSKGEMKYKRDYGATATTLNDGRVLITGGVYNRSVNPKYLSFITVNPENSEIYGPKTGMFSKIANLCVPRDGHNAILMDNGKVLIIGGYNRQEQPSQAYVREIEEFDPQTNTFKIIAKIPYAVGASAIKLNNNKILIFGAGFPTDEDIKPIYKLLFGPDFPKGKNTGLIYDYTTNTFENHNNPLLEAPGQYKTATLDDGRILFYASYLKRLLLIDPDLKEIKQLSNTEIKERNLDYTLTQINEGIILIGGSEGSHMSYWLPKKTLIFDPDLMAFKENKAKLNIWRASHLAVKLKNGNILIIGGHKWLQDKEVLQSEIYYQ